MGNAIRLSGWGPIAVDGVAREGGRGEKVAARLKTGHKNEARKMGTFFGSNNEEVPFLRPQCGPVF